MLRSLRQLRFLVPLLPAAAAVPGAAAAPNGDATAFFEKHVRPALVKHCYECHSVEADKQKGGLLLDSKLGWQNGGDSGPAIVPGNPDESLFVEAVRYHNTDLEMPPDGKMPKRTIALLEQWILEGAHDPRDATHLQATASTGDTIDLEQGREFWSFQPIAAPESPPVKNADWPRSSSDRFLLAELEANGLTPAPDAPPATLVRRLHLDLTGLPPTPAELQSFLDAHAADAEASIAHRIDELLARPEFGERWGRHWLDLARYADSSGGGRAIPLPDAWRFRDYVIDAFNDDRPLDRLIREHVAGDLLPYESREEQIQNLIGTGFLVLGPHNYENQDKELLDLEIADEQIDTIGRAFLGMTIGCARCHDHKFDPIPTGDYYALAGIMMSTASVNHSNVSKWQTAPLPPTPEQAAAITHAEETLQPLRKKLVRVKVELAGLGVGAGGMMKSVPRSALAGIVLETGDAELEGEWEPSTSAGRFVGAGYLHDRRETKGQKSVTWRPKLPESGKYQVRLSYSPSGNRSARVPVTILHANGRDRVLVNQRLTPEYDGLYQSLGEFHFAPGGKASVRITTEESDDGVVIADSVQFLLKGKPAEPEASLGPPRKSAGEVEQIAALEKSRKSLEKDIAAAEKSSPQLPTAMCVSEGQEAADIAVRIRGEARNYGDPVPRGFLRVTLPSPNEAPAITSGSGRHELAEWIVSPANPLTARVLANRIWLHLVGEGIVRSPDNFGITGDAPSHPELLDHLARSLIEHGWSPKQLIRSIALSRAYRMSSAHADLVAQRLDGENRLLWRAHRRSADAETLRDTMLLVAGNLDHNRGGPSLPRGFKSEFGYEFTTLKRSVYVPVFRNTLHELLGTFDFANPNFTVGKRAGSTIPTQSLFLVNSPFVHEQAEAAAKRLLADPEARDARARIRLAWRRTLCRDPHPDELALAESFLEEMGDAPATWTALQRSLFASIDFRYIE